MTAETGSRSESQTWFGSGLEKIKKSAMTSLDKLNNNNKLCYKCDIYYIKIFSSSSSVFTNRPGFFPAFFSPRSETVSSMRIRIPEALFKCVFGARERKKNVLLIIARKVTSTISQLWASFSSRHDWADKWLFFHKSGLRIQREIQFYWHTWHTYATIFHVAFI